MSVFADCFDVVGFVHSRCAPPGELHLEQRSCRSHTAPAPLGRFQLATFIDRVTMKLFCRLYHFETKETAWYAMTADRETLAKIAATGNGTEAARL